MVQHPAPVSTPENPLSRLEASPTTSSGLELRASGETHRTPWSHAHTAAKHHVITALGRFILLRRGEGMNILLQREEQSTAIHPLQDQDRKYPVQAGDGTRGAPR